MSDNPYLETVDFDNVASRAWNKGYDQAIEDATKICEQTPRIAKSDDSIVKDIQMELEALRKKVEE